MTSTPNPTWYDVLRVPQDASHDEIKAAWRAATDTYEPGTGAGQFRMLNDAADVLLDPERRREYDASLGLDVPPAAPVVTSSPSQDEPPPPPAPEPLEEASRAAEPVGSASEGERATRRAGVLALVLALLTMGALVAAGYLGLKMRTDAQIAAARDDAPVAAEQAAKAILAYDYQTLPEDRKRAGTFLTADFKKKYLKNFELLEKQQDGTPGAAVQTKTVVKATVVGSGVMDVEPDTARILVYVNQVSEKPGVDPQIFQNRVAVTMQKVGSRWLVDDLKSY